MRIVVLFALWSVSAAGTAAVRTDVFLVQGTEAGRQAVETTAGGVTHAAYEFLDRGHGEKIAATWRLDAGGVPVEYEATGNNYQTVPVEERYD